MTDCASAERDTERSPADLATASGPIRAWYRSVSPKMVNGVTVTETIVGFTNRRPEPRVTETSFQGNSGRGIYLGASTLPTVPAQDAVIQGNLIGTDANGTAELGNLHRH